LSHRFLRILPWLALTGASAAEAQQLEEALPTVVVVGSHIDGPRTGAAFPITVLTADQIAATGAESGDDLMRTIPQMGDVTFNASNDQQTSNAARGDVASIDLRGSGLGDTLVLLNGRRVVEHPTSQSRGGVPLISYNAQALPTTGIDRVEVLRQGAAAIYGADAVAGVVNVVTKTDFDGASADIRYGFAQGTHREEATANLALGGDFLDRRGNVALFVSAAHRESQLPGDESYTASQDLRPLFAAYPGYNTSTVPDGRGNQSSFAALVARNRNGAALSSAITQGTVALTSAAGSFHVQPTTLSGCVSPVGKGLCIGRGTVPYATTANSLRYDARALDAITLSPEVDRQNLSLNAHYLLSDEHTVYMELDYYRARSRALTTQPTALVPIGVPASNYYNPFGPTTFADGTANPNRLPNLANVPASGLPVSFSTYRFNDLGPDHVDVAGFQDRFLLGMKGRIGGFQYDTAALYGEGQVRDVSDAIDSALLAKQLALSTPDAYNPFNGGCLDGSGGRDCTPSTAVALDAIRFRLRRQSTSRLVNVDYKLSRSDLLSLRSGDVGLALGLEGRFEKHSDDRDPHNSGAIPFVDPVLGTVAVSSAIGVNNTPSTTDSRNVFSFFSELAIPLARSLDLQLAGRFEHYSDFGSITRPKVALAWAVVPDVRLRASWEQGFKAPNLETTAAYTYSRAQTLTDWYRCQAALNKGRLTSFNACNENVGISYAESGNPQLRPERTQSYDFGVVMQRGAWQFSVDRWRLRQVGIVGVIGFDTVSVEDYLNRATGGSGSPNLIRAAPTADDVAFYSGSGLAPVGAPLVVNDSFRNLQPKIISGIDVSLAWKAATERFGSFDGHVDATHLDRYSQPPAPELQLLYDGRAAGTINAATPLDNPGDRLRVLGSPKWKATASLTWTFRSVQVGSSVIHTGSTLDTNFLSSGGEPWRVASLITINLYAQYRVRDSLRFTAGARNLFDRGSPLESDGFNGALYLPYGRYLYFKLAFLF
jgi:iron complex outermembrane recepter protein